MRTYVRAIDLNALTRSVEVDNRMSLAFYYRLADNLLKQARIYREEKNLIDLYIILLRYSSLLCETIPSHHEYQTLPPIFKKKLLDVMNELESLKPEVLRQVGQLNREHTLESSTQKRISNSSAPNRQSPLNAHIEQAPVSTSLSAWRSSNETNQIVSPDNLRTERSIHKKSFGIVNPKEETLSRHSILGPHGLRGNNAGPISGIRVQYPSNFESIQSGSTTRNQSGESSSTVTNERDAKKNNYDLESLLSLDDGQWSIPVEESGSFLKSAVEEDFNHLNIRQPCPPPVLAQVQPKPREISPNKIADPRPGPAKPSQDGTKAFQDLHVPVKIMESFLRLAEKNTAKNLETCGILAGSLKNRVFFVTTLIIPKQESTSDSHHLAGSQSQLEAIQIGSMPGKQGEYNPCQTTDEEEIFNVQDKLSLFPLGWIHTHPTQTCFMSSIDLHTHYSYQIMLPEAIAIVMAPTDTSRTHGIFHLSDPSGVNLIRNCQERGFHPHEEPLDGSPIYEHCSHVYMNPNLKYDVIDLRKL